MNLFVLDKDPSIAAKYNCDLHCNKILLEFCQMAANCFKPETLEDAPKTQKGTTRKHSYYNHPVSKWMRHSTANLEWSIEHAIELENERIYRGYNPHFSFAFVEWVLDNIGRSIVPSGVLAPFSVAIAEDKNCRKVPNFSSLDPVEQYRLYYKYDKPFASWTKREVPDWFLSK
jgi:hypothetical protein